MDLPYPPASPPPDPAKATVSPPLVAIDGEVFFASGVDSFGVPEVPVSWHAIASEFSINPIIGDSGADRVAESGSLCTQLRKS